MPLTPHQLKMRNAVDQDNPLRSVREPGEGTFWYIGTMCIKPATARAIRPHFAWRVEKKTLRGGIEVSYYKENPEYKEDDNGEH
jgi:hypothetical protein